MASCSACCGLLFSRLPDGCGSERAEGWLTSLGLGLGLGIGSGSGSGLRLGLGVGVGLRAGLAVLGDLRLAVLAGWGTGFGWGGGRWRFSSDSVAAARAGGTREPHGFARQWARSASAAFLQSEPSRRRCNGIGRDGAQS